MDKVGDMGGVTRPVGELGWDRPSGPAAAAGLADGRARAGDDWGLKGTEAVMRIPVGVQIVLGSARMPVSKLMSLTRGAIIPLDRKVGDMVDIVVNDRIVARGEVVVLDEEASRFGVSVREVVTVCED